MLSVGLVGAAGAMATAAPAQADPVTDSFLAALAGAGIPAIDEATAVSVGQSVCPMLAEPGQNVANVAATVADAIGKPLGPATMFTGIAIRLFCPGMIASLGKAMPTLPLDLPGV